MAITFIQTIAGSGSFLSNNTAGNFLVAIFRGPATENIHDTIGNSWVKAAGINNTGSNGTYIWYVLNCKGGANQVQQTGGSGQFVASEFSGVALTSALDKTNAAIGVGNPYASGSISSLASANEVIIGGVSNETTNGNTDTPTGGFADTVGGSGNGNTFLAYQIISALGTYSYGGSYSGVGNSWAAAVASFIAASYSISGNAGVAGATVSWTGTSSGSTTADGSGNYTIPGLANGTYTITPTLTGYSFSPTSQNETLSGSNITGVNFTATANPPAGGSGSWLQFGRDFINKRGVRG